jgi:hypothetical protein
MGPAGRDGNPGPAGPPGPPGKTPFIPLPPAGAFKGQSDEEIAEVMPVEALKLLKRQMDQLDSGSKKSTPRTCSDIYVKNSAAVSDQYFVDPNGGSESDAIEVYCNFDSEEVQTCVQPYNASQSPLEYVQNAVDSSQMGYLQVNYRYATQVVNFDCADGRPEVTLTADSDFTFGVSHRDVTVISDTCSEGGELVLEVTSRSANMPINEVDEGNFEMEPVCFFA